MYIGLHVLYPFVIRLENFHQIFEKSSNVKLKKKSFQRLPLDAMFHIDRRDEAKSRF
jgi:hypothetical protein